MELVSKTSLLRYARGLTLDGYESRRQVHPILGMGFTCIRPMVGGQVDRRENLAVVKVGSWTERPLGCERIITQPVKQVT